MVILTSLSTGHVCYLPLHIKINEKHINKLSASFQMIGKVYVETYFWPTLLNGLQQWLF